MKKYAEIIKFTIFSLGAGIVQFLSFTVLTLWTRLPYIYTYVISLALSVLFSFTLNRKFTFKDASNVPVAMLKMLLFYAVFTPLSTWLGDFLVVRLLWNEFVVEIIIMIINMVLEFLYQKFYVFKK